MTVATQGPTAALCEFAAETQLADVPADVIERATHLILDGLGCGLFAAKLDHSQRAVRALTGPVAGGGTSIWGWGRTTEPVTAAVLNGTFVQGFELDDYHERGPLHSQSCVLPAMLSALSLGAEVSGEDVLLAALLGFETGPRIGASLGGLNLIARGWHCGPINGTISSAVGVGRTLGLDVRHMEYAIGIAATQACGLMSAQYEAMVKRMHSGFAARNGLLAGMLAQQDFTGIDAVLEREYGGFAACFTQGEADLSKLTDELGTRWELTSISVKPYSCMGGLHTAVDAMRKLRQDDGIAAEDIVHIDVGLPEAMHSHGGWRPQRPATSTGAQMNIAYAIAVTALEGTAFVHQYAPDHLDSDAVWGLIDRIETYRNPEFDALGEDGRWSCLLDVETRDGKHHRCDVRHPLGSPTHPLSNEDIRKKFDSLTELVLEPAEAQAIHDAVMGLADAPDASALLKALSVEARDPFEAKAVAGTALGGAPAAGTAPAAGAAAAGRDDGSR